MPRYLWDHRPIVRSFDVDVNQTQIGHQNEFSVVGEQLTHETERCPTDLVDFVVGPELAVHALHHPVADTAISSVAVTVTHLGKFLLGSASQPGLFSNLPQRALERRFATASSALRQRPVLSIRPVDHEHLIVMPT
jgi:hypothetical protein